MFQGKYYRKGSKMTIKLEPFETVQIQSQDNLRGTKVISRLPVAVSSGHSCVQIYTSCNHVYVSLLAAGDKNSSLHHCLIIRSFLINMTVFTSKHPRTPELPSILMERSRVTLCLQDKLWNSTLSGHMLCIWHLTRVSRSYLNSTGALMMH